MPKNQPRLITAECEWCGEEFTYMYSGHGMKQVFCSEECRDNQTRFLSGKGIFGNSRYLKGDKNKLHTRMKQLDAEGRTYGDYARERTLATVPKIDVNIERREK